MMYVTRLYHHHLYVFEEVEVSFLCFQISIFERVFLRIDNVILVTGTKKKGIQS